VADEDLIGPLDVLIDQRRVRGQHGVVVQPVLQEAGLEAVEPRVDEDRPVAERDLPAVGAEPLEAHAGRAGAAAARWRLGALGHPRHAQRAAGVGGGQRDAGETGAEESAP